MNNKILLIEDDYSISDALTFALRKEGFNVRQGFTGEEGLDLFNRFEPELVILDLMLPDMNGFDICKKIAGENSIPIIMLTARNDIVDKVLGLELGADDYITKPFDVREVITRIKVALRRVESYANKREEDVNTIELCKDIKIYKDRRTVYKNEEEIRLKPREFDLLLFLAERKGMVFTRESLLDYVWDMDYDGDLRTVDIHVRRIRSKLDGQEGDSIIETVFGVGYKMRDYNE